MIEQIRNAVIYRLIVLSDPEFFAETDECWIYFCDPDNADAYRKSGEIGGAVYLEIGQKGESKQQLILHSGESKTKMLLPTAELMYESMTGSEVVNEPTEIAVYTDPIDMLEQTRQDIINTVNQYAAVIFSLQEEMFILEYQNASFQEKIMNIELYKHLLKEEGTENTDEIEMEILEIEALINENEQRRQELSELIDYMMSTKYLAESQLDMLETQIAELEELIDSYYIK